MRKPRNTNTTNASWEIIIILECFEIQTNKSEKERNVTHLYLTERYFEGKRICKPDKNLVNVELSEVRVKNVTGRVQ